MVFCGRRTYKDSNGKCYNISGMKVNEILALVETTHHKHLEGHEDHDKKEHNDHDDDHDEDHDEDHHD